MKKFKFSKSAAVISVQLAILLVLTLSLCFKSREAASENFFLQNENESPEKSDGKKKNDYIHWVDFTVPADVLEAAFRYDVNTCQEQLHLNWIELLSYLGAKYGGDFTKYKSADMTALVEKLQGGQTMDELTGKMKYYPYYKEAYTAVLGGMVGYFDEEIDSPTEEYPAGQSPSNPEAEDGGAGAGQIRGAEHAQAADGAQTAGQNGAQSLQAAKQNGAQGAQAAGQNGAQGAQAAGQNGAQSAQAAGQNGGAAPTETPAQKVWVTKYGLKAFSPIAKSFPYSDFDDFGVARSYGYKRQHLGHDMMGQVGTPVIAVESGYVEALGWNQYGGWRIGIRSFDKKRYYYYAHLRKDYPYQSSLQEGSIVTAGDVIGYLGRTGYSAAENTNNISTPHLHFGLQLIFDESQKEGSNEIWVDCYELTKFLRLNQSKVVKVEGTKEWARVYQLKDRVTNP